MLSPLVPQSLPTKLFNLGNKFFALALTKSLEVATEPAAINK